MRRCGNAEPALEFFEYVTNLVHRNAGPRLRSRSTPALPTAAPIAFVNSRSPDTGRVGT